jgi:hypothetical protein
LTVKTLMLLSLFCGLASAAVEQWQVTVGEMKVPFHSWVADAIKPTGGVLVLVPGYNGDGAAMLDPRWKLFAETHRLVLLAPSFDLSR